MKKLFTLAAVLVAAMTMNAAAGSWQFSGGDAPAVGSTETGTNMKVEFLTTDNSKSFGNESASYNAAVPADLKSQGSKGIKMGSNALYLKVYLTDDTPFAKGDTLFICGYLPWKISSTSAQTGDVAASLATGSGKTDYNVGSIILADDVDTLYLMRATSSGTGIAAIRYAEFVDPGVPMLDTDNDELDLRIGRSGATDKSASFTLSGIHLDGLTTSLEFPVHDGLSIDKDELEVALDGTISQKFTVTYAPTVSEEEFNGTIVIKAGDDITVNINVICNVFVPFVQNTIAESTTWDFDGAASADIAAPTTEDILLANASEDWAAGFAAQDLVANGAQYLFYKSYNCYQGKVLSFKTSVAGKVSVIYSNTGNRDKAEEARILTINDVKYGEGSMKSNAKDTIENVAVEAGDVKISALLKKDDSVQMIRIYKVVFTKADATAIENTEATDPKALKVVENGQLFIIKNGVKYNAQGAVVK